MIILTAGHTGAGTGAQCITTQFDEGAENIWLRNRVAEILTNKYGLVVLVDEDKASLKLLVKELSRDTACRVLSVNRPNERLKPIPISADTIEITLSRDAACCVRSTSGSKNNTSNKRANARQDTARCVPTIRSIASTRGVSVKTTHTDTTQTLRITLKPDTIFVPYVHHIRSDTIVIPDPTTKAKLTTARWQIVALILILIAIIIILFLRQNDKKT